MLYLNKKFERIWAGREPFDELAKVNGQIYRQVKNRKTFQFEVEGESYFAKLHWGIGWREIVKNLLQFRLPILGAENEWQAINKLESLNIDTMKYVAYGSKGKNPAAQQSFIVTRELTATTSLEDYCRGWNERQPSFSEKFALQKEIAKISKTLHGNGVCHRDFYLCHFLLHAGHSQQEPKLSLIDLHRALVKQKLSMRWIVKDVAGLYYSAMDIGLSRRDLFRFIRYYSGSSLKQELRSNSKFWCAVEARATKLYKKLGPATPAT